MYRDETGVLKAIIWHIYRSIQHAVVNMSMKEAFCEHIPN